MAPYKSTVELSCNSDKIRQCHTWISRRQLLNTSSIIASRRTQFKQKGRTQFLLVYELFSQPWWQAVRQSGTHRDTRWETKLSTEYLDEHKPTSIMLTSGQAPNSNPLAGFFMRAQPAKPAWTVIHLHTHAKRLCFAIFKQERLCNRHKQKCLASFRCR